MGRIKIRTRKPGYYDAMKRPGSWPVGRPLSVEETARSIVKGLGVCAAVDYLRKRGFDKDFTMWLITGQRTPSSERDTEFLATQQENRA